ncbi:hypothetical protein ACU4GD_43985 [Cupriavidus basilensis]
MDLNLIQAFVDIVEAGNFESKRDGGAASRARRSAASCANWNTRPARSCCAVPRAGWS